EDPPTGLGHGEVSEAVRRPGKCRGRPGKVQDRERRIRNRGERPRRASCEAFDEARRLSGRRREDDPGGRKLLVHRPDRPGIAESNQFDDGSLRPQAAAKAGRQRPRKSFESFLKCEKPPDRTLRTSLSEKSLGKGADEQTAILLFPLGQPRK